MVPMSSGNQRKVAQSSAKNNRNWFAWSENDVQQNVMQLNSDASATAQFSQERKRRSAERHAAQAKLPLPAPNSKCSLAMPSPISDCTPSRASAFTVTVQGNGEPMTIHGRN
ncbi:hypothetical protein ACT544_04445 [Bifidobacterium longum]|uniref:hypothetical protein n=1 Tax=Bifidobacterium longum TaxID=216816 RepID=UPI0040341202